jgi:hypothetical protein
MASRCDFCLYAPADATPPIQQIHITAGHIVSFASMRELAQGVVANIDNFEQLNRLQRAAYEKCGTGFDWSDRGRTLRDAIQEAVHDNMAMTSTRARSNADPGS